MDSVKEENPEEDIPSSTQKGTKEQKNFNWTALSILSSFILGIAGIIVSIILSHSNEKTKYAELAMNHKPVLKVDSFFIECKFNVLPPDRSVLDMTKQFKQKITIYPDSSSIKLWVRNTGNSYAKIISSAAADTLIGTPILRKWLLDDDEREKRFYSEEWGAYFSEQNIPPKGRDSIILPVFIVWNPAINQGTVHVILFYKNEFDALYDTYYWMKYQIGTLKSYFGTRITDGESYTLLFGLSNEQLSTELIQREDIREDPKVYNYEERNSILKFIGKKSD